MKIRWLFLALPAGLLCLAAAGEPQSQQAVAGTHGVVAALHPLSAQVGLSVLQKGGNAVDAVVASAAADTIFRLGSSGIGGVGGYALFYVAKENKVYALDFIGVAPRKVRVNEMTRADLWSGYKSIMVPGAVAGWAAAVERFGTMSLKELMQPAIEYAENGFPVSPSLGSRLRLPVRGVSLLPEGTRPPEPGDLLVLKDLAETYRIIGNEGAGALYGGSIARRLVPEIQRNGGLLTLEDFASYKAEWKEPLSTSYRGHTVYSQPPGSSGMTILQSLNILEDWNVAQLGHNSVDFIHVMAEVQKMALADDDRYNTGKSYAKIPLDKLLSKPYAMRQALRLNLDQAQFYPAQGSLSRQTGTTHMAVADREGNVASLTQTTMMLTIPPLARTGIHFASGLCYYSLEPDDINRVEGGERARYVMSPTMVFREGKPWFSLGAAGGWGIPQAVFQVIVRVIDFRMDLQEAVSAQRITLCYKDNFIPYVPGTTLALEGEFPEATVRALEKRGHLIHGMTYPGSTGGFAAVAAVMLNAGGKVFRGAAEPPEGQAAAW
jgi:gamma-glutamyltranspeptidase/glutathione hydrolase